jgi:hypothetical protein
MFNVCERTAALTVPLTRHAQCAGDVGRAEATWDLPDLDPGARDEPFPSLAGTLPVTLALFTVVFAFFKGGEALSVARAHGITALASFIMWPDARAYGIVGGASNSGGPAGGEVTEQSASGSVSESTSPALVMTLAVGVAVMSCVQVLQIPLRIGREIARRGIVAGSEQAVCRASASSATPPQHTHTHTRARAHTHTQHTHHTHTHTHTHIHTPLSNIVPTTTAILM